MIEAYKKFWKNYVNFTGTSSRGDYWWVFLCNIIVEFVLGLIPIWKYTMTYPGMNYSLSMSYLVFIYELAILVPSIAIVARRFRDAGKSPWLMLLFLIPLANIYPLIILFLPSKKA